MPFQILESGIFPYDHQFRVAYVFDTPLDSEAQDDAEPDELAEAFDGHYEFYGVLDEDADIAAALPSRSSIELSTYYGSLMHTLLPRYTLPDMENVGAAYSTDYLLTSELALGTKPLPKGKYALAFKITDVFGNVQSSEVFYADWNGQTATYSGVDVLEDTEPEAVAE